MNYQIFKGGWEGDVTDRIVPNQRPADGHIKSAVWEDYRKLTQRQLGCANSCGVLNALEVGDVVGMHTTLTLSNILAFGIAVNVAEEGLKLKVVSRDGYVELSKILVNVYEYDAENEEFTLVDEKKPLDTIDDIGNAQRYYAGFVEKYNDVIVKNTDMLGFEVVALPADGLSGEFEIETRLHNSQPVRPPACLACC